MSNDFGPELKIYEITHRTTGDKIYQVALSAEDAYQRSGRIPADCFITEQKPRRKPVPDTATLILYRIPCEVCPYQYATCDKPEHAECPIQTNVPDFKEWLKRAAEAHLCPHVGIALHKTDYNLHQKWVSLEQALKELSS